MTQDDIFYREPYRPQWHYSPPCGWMNDPNGLVFYDGEYHLFFQFYPASIEQGPKHWGHAVSTDLVHWQTLPIALYPDAIGAIWSGSVVVDADNTSGLVPGGGLVAMYSYENQSQGIAYSQDRGRTWTKYAGNPVLAAAARDFRDPKIIWYAPAQQWVMVLAAGQEVRFFTSPDLLTWSQSGRFSAGHLVGVWEVPDLFPLTINGTTHWVLLVSVSAGAPAGGSGIQYFIGQFDGATFRVDDPARVLWLDYGADNYAGITFDNLPRRLYIGWMSNWVYAGRTPTTPWRGAMTLPRELTLAHTPDGLRLVQTPAPELAALRGPGRTVPPQALEGTVLTGIQGRRLEISATLTAGSAERFGLSVHHQAGGSTRILYNTRVGQLLIGRSDQTPQGPIDGFNPAFGVPLALDDGRLTLHVFVDESSVEVFTADGIAVMTAQSFGDPAADGLAVFAEGGRATLEHLEVYPLAGIWSPPPRRQEFDFCG